MRHIRSPLQPQSPPFLGAGVGDGGGAPPLLPPTPGPGLGPGPGRGGAYPPLPAFADATLADSGTCAKFSAEVFPPPATMLILLQGSTSMNAASKWSTAQQAVMQAGVEGEKNLLVPDGERLAEGSIHQREHIGSVGLDGTDHVGLAGGG